MSTPPYLFKYQKVTEHSLLSLVEGTVWMASPDSFNDPFDCAINLDQNRLSESVAHALELVSKARNVPVDESLWAVNPEDKTAYAELRASLKAQIQAIGVLCLSIPMIHRISYFQLHVSHLPLICYGTTGLEGR